MSNIKKAYQPIVDLLTSAMENNKNVKVAEVLDQVVELASAKVGRGGGGSASTYIKDASGTVVAINDYYFKRWMPLVGDKAVEFGVKKGTPTGFNTMSKEGVSNWTRQQREAKAAEAELLGKVGSGEIQPVDIAKHQAVIEENRKAIAPTELGFDNVDDLMKYLKKNGVEATAPTTKAAE